MLGYRVWSQRISAVEKRLFRAFVSKILFLEDADEGSLTFMVVHHAAPQAKETAQFCTANSDCLRKNRDITCAVKRRLSTAGESPARELGSLHPEAIGAAVEETKPSEPPV